MLHRSAVVRWVPRYARQCPWVRPRGQRAAAAAGRANVASNCSPMFLAVNEDNGEVMMATKARQHDVQKEASSALDPTVTGVSQMLLRKAETLLHRWKNLNETMLIHCIGGVPFIARNLSPNKMKESFLKQEQDAVSFMAQTEVFAVVKDMLPLSTHQGDIGDRSETDEIRNNPQEDSRQGGGLTCRTSSMVVIPDEATTDAVKYLEQLGKHRIEAVQGKADLVKGSSPTLPVIFSLPEIVVFLQLYDEMNCEDGELLLRLLAELRRIVFSARKEVGDEKRMLSEAEEGVVSRLLLTLSSLGIAEEHVLQRLVTVNGGRFMSRAKLARYSEADLVRLLVAFGRFKLHHEPCFNVTAKTLRRKSLCSPLRSFRRRALAYASGAVSEGNTKRVSVSSLMAGLTLNDLLEALTAIALSLCRDVEVVELLAASIVTAVEEEEDRGRSNRGEAQTRDEELGFVRTLQVHRATKVCEQMELAQPALAQLLHRLSIRYGGVLADGGEDALSPERVGFYDFITADLVKVRHS
ncbi:hypothetical protein TraAM80_09385 [Trypanosoma rangeli]|uniref:Uncharacterized protein n=1 Tax=Trypanosoma rangeli TaxID=5698 RepID=A0A3R7M711_TRYRA|nr:uncharacterized protein TraAM80_09385 [Trypanosoma rangeli]RNE97330.1 hypothetical protein TraAM80_09385 [Trypanosoma rangeli]|eukprot:RNE97330.1 hypothetical protein TraAM80_09385 [Trypanosoma rangeli]